MRTAQLPHRAGLVAGAPLTVGWGGARQEPRAGPSAARRWDEWEPHPDETQIQPWTFPFFPLSAPPLLLLIFNLIFSSHILQGELSKSTTTGSRRGWLSEQT